MSAVKSMKAPKATNPQPKPMVLMTEDALDHVVAQVKKLDHQSNSVAWRMGVLLVDIYDKGLWTLRTTPAGDRLYRTFESFITSEFDFTGPYAYCLMNLARNYSEDVVAEIGASKATTILRAPPEARANLVREARGGASKSRIQSLVYEALRKSDWRGSPKQVAARRSNVTKNRKKEAARQLAPKATDHEVWVKRFETALRDVVAQLKKRHPAQALKIAELALQSKAVSR